MNTPHTTRRAIATTVVGLLLAGALAGCAADSEPDTDDATGTAAPAHDYSQGLDENGFWADVVALDLVTLPDYAHVEVPADTHTITDDAVAAQIDSLLAGYATEEQVTDRAIEDGDTVNIDYVGTIDGVEFEGGSSNGAGSDVTAGSAEFIDDFLTQIIGHTPGESFDVAVTFPDDYHNTEYAGKDAVFATTINYIATQVVPEATDAFVAENLTASYGWTTAAEMTDGIRAELQRTAVADYLTTYLEQESTVSSVPDSVREAQEGAFLAYHESSAAQFGMPLTEYLSTYLGVDDEAALLEQSEESLTTQANSSLVVQAIAEDAGITVTDEDLTAYVEENMGDADYAGLEAQYGVPYLKLAVLTETVMDQVIAGAVLL